MADYPDIYADRFAISAGPFGVTVTLQLSDPSGEPGPHQEQNVTLGRVRLSREIARVFAEQLNQLLVTSAQVQVQTSSDVKH